MNTFHHFIKTNIQLYKAFDPSTTPCIHQSTIAQSPASNHALSFIGTVRRILVMCSPSGARFCCCSSSKSLCSCARTGFPCFRNSCVKQPSAVTASARYLHGDKKQLLRICLRPHACIAKAIQN